MKTVIVLIMHGMMPKDFPQDQKSEYMSLRARFHSHGPNHAPKDLPSAKRYEELETFVRQWARSEHNDPFFTATMRITKHLEQMAGCPVIAGFNEFCAPSASLALSRAAALGPEKIIVTTPMMTAGGSHAEIEIPELIHEARQKNPNISYTYAWPFEEEAIAQFLKDKLVSDGLL